MPVRELTVAGGLVQNAFLMQVYADVLRRPLHVVESDQAPALGSAIHAAVAAGCHRDVLEASKAMGRVRRDGFVPDADAADRYDELFDHYATLHDHFGRRSRMMRELRRPTGRRRAGRTATVASLRAELAELHAELPRHGS